MSASLGWNHGSDAWSWGWGCGFADVMPGKPTVSAFITLGGLLAGCGVS